MFDFNLLLHKLQKDNYTSLLMCIVELVTLFIAFKYKQQNLLWRVFTIYLAVDFSVLISDFLLTANTGFSSKTRNRYFNYTNSLIALVELICYYTFFATFFTKKWKKRVLIYSGFLFLSLSIVFIIGSISFFSKRMHYFSNLLGTIEFILIVPFCLLYYKQLLNTTSGIEILKRPSFWITTGIFFYSFFSIPSYLLYDYIRINHPAITYDFFAIFYYIPFTINFIFLAKAFSLKKELSA